MTCRQADNLVLLWESGPSPQDADLRALESHLAQCPTCRARYGWQVELSAMVRGAAEEVPLGFAADVMARIAADSSARTAEGDAPSHKKMRPLRRWVVGLAAAVMLLAIGPTALHRLQLLQATREMVDAQASPSLESEGDLVPYRLTPTQTPSPAVSQDQTPLSPQGVPENAAETSEGAASHSAALEQHSGEDGETDGTLSTLQTESALDIQARTEAIDWSAPLVTKGTTRPRILRTVSLPETSRGGIDFVDRLWPSNNAPADRGGGTALVGSTYGTAGNATVEPTLPPSTPQEAHPKPSSVDLAVQPPVWAVILPTVLLREQQDVAAVLTQETPPEFYEECIETETETYYVVLSEQGYLLVIVPISE